MSPELAKLLNSTLPSTLGVFAGSLPLMGVIGWFSFHQSDRFRRLESQVDDLSSKIDKLTDAVSSVRSDVSVILDRDKRQPELGRVIIPA